MERGHQMDGWPSSVVTRWMGDRRAWSPDGWVTLRAKLCARPEIVFFSFLFSFLPESNSVQSLQNSFGWVYKPRSSLVCAYTHTARSHTHIKDPVVLVRVQWVTETPKQASIHWNCRKFFSVFKLDAIRKKKKKKKKKKKQAPLLSKTPAYVGRLHKVLPAQTESTDALQILNWKFKSCLPFSHHALMYVAAACSRSVNNDAR